jgi:eukaryotic-like serine/threonine-protein kinase
MVSFTGTDRYELLTKLGQGGMGAVYAVYDKRRQRKVALKVLSDPEGGSLFRFKREFRTMADLRHPNLVRLFDLGVLPNGGFFFTMELIEGDELGDHFTSAKRQAVGATIQGLADTVEEAPWAATSEDDTLTTTTPTTSLLAPDTGDVVTVMAGVVAGLRCLHRARKVHRDLKPSNVVVDTSGRPRLLDFGILHELDTGGAMTGAGAVGTPLYMAPEQVAGDEVTPATDMYSLGCMLYALLAGCPPFTGPANRVLMKHLREAPAPPSRHRTCDADLETLTLQLLNKDPGERPCVDTVLDRLIALGGTPPTEGTTQLKPARAVEFVGRNPDLQQLSRAVGEAKEGARIVLVGGESGVGKSALVNEFALRLVDEGTRPWFGVCYEREHVPYKAFDAIVDAAVVALMQRGERAGHFLPDGTPSLARLFPVLREVPAVGALPAETSLHDPQAERDRAGLAFFELMRRLSGGRPPVFIIEDLQRADPASFEVLQWLSTMPDPPPCLVVATYRADEVDPDSDLGTLGEQSKRVSRLTLEPLSRDAAEQLARAHLSGTISESQLARLVDDAAGNPFLAVELALASRDLQGDAMPTVVELVERRLSDLTGGVRSVLEAAAVAGGGASFPLLLRASGLEPGDLSDAIDELLRSQLLREGQSSGSEDAYDLAHSRLGQAVYERVSEERRRELHRLLAQELADSGDAARAVEHWRLAGEATRAREAAMEAAAEAEEKLAFEQAAELYALALTDEASLDLRVKLAHALKKAGRHRDAASAFEDAAGKAPPEEARDLALKGATEHLAAGAVTEGMAAFERILKALGVPLVRNKWATLIGIGWRMILLQITWFVWDISGRFLPKRKRPAPTPKEEYELRVFDAIHHHLTIHRPLESARFGVRHSLMSRRYDHPLHQGRARIGYALFLAAELGGLFRRRAFHHLQIGESLCAEAKDSEGLLYAHQVRAYLYLIQSNFEGIRRVSADAEIMARRAGLHGEPTLMILHSIHVGSELFSGELPRLVEAAEGYLRGARARNNTWGLAWPLALLGYVRLFQGDEERGKAALNEALALTPEVPMTLSRVHVETFAVSAYLFDGKPEEGLAALEDLKKRCEDSGLVTTSLEASTYRLMRARLILLTAVQKTGWRPEKETCRLGLTLRRLLPATSSTREEMLRLEAASALRNGQPRRGLEFVERAIYLAELRANRFGLGMLLIARAAFRVRLGLPGADYDRERGFRELAAIGIGPDCYVLKNEGWLEPQDPPSCADACPI